METEPDEAVDYTQWVVFAFYKDSSQKTTCFEANSFHGYFQTHDGKYLYTWLSPLSTLVRIQKRNTDVFFLFCFVWFFFNSFSHLLFFSKILLAHNVPAIVLRSRYVYRGCKESPFKCKIHLVFLFFLASCFFRGLRLSLCLLSRLSRAGEHNHKHTHGALFPPHPLPLS